MDAAREASFRRFYDDEFARTYAFLVARTGDRWLAEEVLQEAFSRAYRDWDRVRTHERPGAWLRTVAANLATSRFRRVAAEGRALLRLSGMRHDDVGEPTAADDELWREVRRLPARQVEAVLLHYVHGLSTAEVALEMRCSEGTAKRHLHRARRTLAERIGVGADGGRA